MFLEHAFVVTNVPRYQSCFTSCALDDHEHSEFRWVSFETGLGMELFAGQRHVLRHVEAEFVRREPVRHLLIAAASPTA